MELTVRTADGWELAMSHRSALGPRKGTALLLHAMMVDGRTMDRPPGGGFATCLAEHGYDVYIADFRGHGRSLPSAAEGGSWSYDDLVFHDVPALTSAVRARSEGPLWVVGHSLGSHVTAASVSSGACTDKPDGYVLLAGNVWLPSWEGSRRRTLKKDLALRLFGAVSRRVGRWPSRRLRMGPADEPLAYVEDLARFWREDAWTSREGHDYVAGLPQIAGPVLFVTGADDELFGHVEGVRSFAEAYGPGRVEFHYARRGALGLGWDPDHMGIVTDARSRPLWDWIANWMLENDPNGSGVVVEGLDDA